MYIGCTGGALYWALEAAAVSPVPEGLYPDPQEPGAVGGTAL